VLEEQTPAPSFSVEDQDGNTHTLADYNGKWLVLYFYPKDSTPGCTTEACEFEENLSSLGKVNAAVLGVSADSVASHKIFADRQGLSFPLLADIDKEVIEAYGVWSEKNRYGKKSMGLIRTTYLIDKEGVVAKVWPNVRVKGHVERVIEELAQRTA
jgi:peroxiredoxin Q/BCP